MTEARERDLSRKTLPAFLTWGIPILVLFGVNFIHGIASPGTIISLIAAALAWMGAGCLINAARCGRLHCRLSGPVFLIGAVAVLAAGFNWIATPGFGALEVFWVTIVLVGLTFVAEWIWGPYGKGRHAS